MKAVVSTVSSAEVKVGGDVVGKVEGPALLALVGVGREDSDSAWQTVTRKIAELRLFPAEGGPWDSTRQFSAMEIGAPVLLVSQFTLMGATAKGRRPSWAQAAPSTVAESVIENMISDLRGRGLTVETGIFGAYMEVSSTNQGPFTVLVEAD